MSTQATNVTFRLSNDVVEAIDDTIDSNRAYADRSHLVECIIAEALDLDDDDDQDEVDACEEEGDFVADVIIETGDDDLDDEDDDDEDED